MSHLTRPRPPSPPWRPVSNPRLFPDGSAWQLGQLGAPGSFSVLVLDIAGCWQVSIAVAVGCAPPTDEQVERARVDFGLGAAEEWPASEGVRILVTAITAEHFEVSKDPAVYTGQMTGRLDISGPGWRDQTIDFAGATVVGLTSSGDEVPISGPVVVPADLPAEVVALQWSGGGQ